MSSIIYLSYALSENSPLYGNNKGIELKPMQQQNKGDSCNTMLWTLPNHAGTHIDTPRHFSKDGKTISDYPADFWVFNRIEVADISDKMTNDHIVTLEDLSDFNIDDPDLLLIKTGFARFRGTDQYTLSPPGVSSETANWLREKFPSIRCVGMDLISVSSYGNREEGRNAHKAFLAPPTGKPILLIEDMDLDFVGELEKVIVSPIRVENADGAPCTVFGVLK